VLFAVAEQADLTVVGEAFADRGYLPDGRLVPRSLPGALVTDLDAVVARVLRIATEGTVIAVDGSLVALPARSVCTHGDTPGAVALASAVRAGLAAAGITVAPFVTTDTTGTTGA
jgi:5-oxoprolinase (ATP-hydrolysing) subunit A